MPSYDDLLNINLSKRGVASCFILNIIYGIELANSWLGFTLSVRAVRLKGLLRVALQELFVLIVFLFCARAADYHAQDTVGWCFHDYSVKIVRKVLNVISNKQKICKIHV